MRGGTVVVADRWFASSKTCSDCGHKRDALPLSVREWMCPACGVVHDRDVNAAINLGKLKRPYRGERRRKSNLIDFLRMLRSLIEGNLNEFIREGGGISDFSLIAGKKTSRMDFEMHFGIRGYRFKITLGPSEDYSLNGEARYYKQSTYELPQVQIVAMRP